MKQAMAAFSSITWKYQRPKEHQPKDQKAKVTTEAVKNRAIAIVDFLKSRSNVSIQDCLDHLKGKHPELSCSRSIFIAMSKDGHGFNLGLPEGVVNTRKGVSKIVVLTKGNDGHN